MLGKIPLARSGALALAALLFAAPLAAFDEGTDYAVLSPPQSTETGSKVEVLEVFWYGCPHCWHLEPTLDQWVATMPAGAQFRRMPGTGPNWTPHARAYYAAEAMGVLDRFHPALFKAMQVDKRRIMSEDDLVNFAGEIGIDKQKFREAYDSFYVETRVRKAEEMQKRYGIDGVPAVIVNGKYRTSPSMTGSIDKFLQVMSFLVDKELKAQAPAASPTPAAEPQPKPAS